MNPATLNRVPSLDTAATFSPQQIVDLTYSLSREIDGLKHQLDWFKRQIFGQKSERRIVDGAYRQMSLGEALDLEQSAPPSPAERSVAAHTRRSAAKKPDAGDETHVGAAAFNDADRCVRADNGLRRLEFDDRPPVLENDVAAGALGEPVAV